MAAKKSKTHDKQLVKDAVEKILKQFGTCSNKIKSSGPQGNIEIRVDLDVSDHFCPPISFDFLKAFADRFGTTSVDVNDFSFKEGCPTCGDYSIDCYLTIKGATV